MQHEDRILRSIDLLTSNARETLIKYVEWARTSNSDVTFNLFDSLPSYDNNGGKGSGAYIKPITIPSFASISSGIFGEVATQSERDINWNFNFIANGKGWNFEEYVQKSGSPAQSSLTPILSINVDTSFGKTKSGRYTNITLDSNNIKYTSTNNTLTLNDGGFRSVINTIDNYGNKHIINGYDVMIGSNSLLVSGITSPKGFTEKDSNSVSIASKNINISALDGKILSYAVGSKNLIIGNMSFDYKLYAKNIENYFNGNYSISTTDYTGKSSIYIADYDINSSKITLAEGLISNVSIGSLSKRLTSNTSEAIQFFVSSSDSAKVWVEGGIDSYYGDRKTATYSDIFSSKIDTEKKALNATSPYYLKIGSVGLTEITGADALILSSNNDIVVSIDNSPEVSIVKGQVTIPNLVLPQMARIGLSTLSKRTQVDNYGPTVIYPSKASTLVNTKGVEVSTLTAFDGVIDLDKSSFIWSSFNSDSTYTYYYLYTIVDNNGINDLVCKTYRTTSGYSKVNFNTPYNTTVVKTNISSKITKDQIYAVSGLNDTYILVTTDDLKFNNNNMSGVSIFKSSDRGVSFRKAASFGTGDSNVFSSINKISASTYSSDVTNCGIQDKLSILVQKNYDNYTRTTLYNNNEYLVYVFDSNTETFYSDCFAKSYKINPSWNASKDTYNSLTSRLASISILGDYAYLVTSNLVNGKFEGKITRIGYLSEVSDKTLTLTNEIFNLNSSSQTIPTNMFLSNTLTMANVTVDGSVKLIASTIFTQYDRNGSVDSNLNRLNIGINFVISGNFDSISVKYTQNGSVKNYSNYILTSSNYHLSETCGYSSIDPTRKVVNGVFFQKSNTASRMMLVEVVSTTYNEITQYYSYNIDNSEINHNTAQVLPINLANFAIYLYNKIVFAYTASYGNSIDYSDLVTSTNTTTSNIKYINKYADSFINNYVDNLGAILSPDCTINYILSNKKSKEISNVIKNYGLDDNNIYESILERRINNEIVNVVSTSDNSDLSELFSVFTYVGGMYDKSPLKNYVKYKTTVNGNEISYSNLKNISIPVSITTCGNNSISLDRKSGVLINNNNTINVNNNVSYSKMAIPVEALSIFTKRAYSNNTVQVSRADFSIDFNPVSVNAVEGITFGFLRHNTTRNNSFKHNSGHSQDVLTNTDLSMYSFEGTVSNGNVSNNTLLIFDSINNRTFAWVPESFTAYTDDILFDSEDNTIWNTKAGILYSIDSSLLNPYDSNFNNYLSITNEKANVVSIRVDYINTLSFQNVNAGSSALVCGFTEINNQEEGC